MESCWDQAIQQGLFKVARHCAGLQLSLWLELQPQLERNPKFRGRSDVLQQVDLVEPAPSLQEHRTRPGQPRRQPDDEQLKAIPNSNPRDDHRHSHGRTSSRRWPRGLAARGPGPRQRAQDKVHLRQHNLRPIRPQANKARSRPGLRRPRHHQVIPLPPPPRRIQRCPDPPRSHRQEAPLGRSAQEEGQGRRGAALQIRRARAQIDRGNTSEQDSRRSRRRHLQRPRPFPQQTHRHQHRCRQRTTKHVPHPAARQYAGTAAAGLARAVEAAARHQRASGLGAGAGGGAEQPVVCVGRGGPDHQDLGSGDGPTAADADGAHLDGARAGCVAAASLHVFVWRGQDGQVLGFGDEQGGEFTTQ
jgi:hypothetical protein